ncbi:MAG: FAD binding domain-containing protein [Anaerolineae bacterium]|nr:FAD binding domain-containing protein [Anaerolineae bacterium]
MMQRWESYYTATSLEDVLQLLDEHRENARIIAGGTDLVVEMRNGTRSPSVLIDVSRIGGLNRITRDGDGDNQNGDRIHIGPLVNHTQAAASPILQKYALPLAQACWWIGAPALRNRGTIAGNVITASPANDTITALRALEANLVFQSVRGVRTVPIGDFYTGVRKTVLSPDEMLVDINMPVLHAHQRGVYLKLGLRRVLAIAVTNVAIKLSFGENEVVTEARIALGSVAPTILRAPDAEQALLGGNLTDTRIQDAADLAVKAARPIDDIRGSAWFRQEEVAALVCRGLEAVRNRSERLDLPQPDDMVKLWGRAIGWPRLSGPTVAHHTGGPEPIQCVVNGKSVAVQGANGKLLLHMLRDDLGLTGSKVGCEEGECGACTVWLDGIATLACLTPAPRAHGACITTVEGLEKDGELHAVQQAFIDEDAVQCGYCTPGFVMSAAKLLEELPTPSRDQITAALSGNLCRCTGYYKIISAVERAAERH